MKLGLAALAAVFTCAPAFAQEAICSGPKMPVEEMQAQVDKAEAQIVATFGPTQAGFWILFATPGGAFFDVWVDLEGKACLSQTFLGDPRKPGASA